VKCSCGCNEEIIIKPHHKYYGTPKYISGHQFRNRKFSEEHKRKLSLIHKRPKPWLKGRKVSKETRDKISNKLKGRIKVLNPIIRKGNYYYIKLRVFHPKANKRGFIKRSHFIMEKHIGRYLKQGEIIHHINEITTDDRLENLKLMTSEEHTSYHQAGRRTKLHKK